MDCFDQDPQATVTGKITDPQGAVVAGATVSVTGTQTGAANNGAAGAGDGGCSRRPARRVGGVLNSRDIAQLPYTTMNPFALQATAAGMVFTGACKPDNSRALDCASTRASHPVASAPGRTNSCCTAIR